MKRRQFHWEGAEETAAANQSWTAASAPKVNVSPIEREVREGGDGAVLCMTARFDATERAPTALRVEAEAGAEALAALDPGLRESLELAATNVRTVAEAQIAFEIEVIELAQGQTVTVREVPVGAAGLYAPGGRAAYPSSVLMCAIPAKVAGVERIALPPRRAPTARSTPLSSPPPSSAGRGDLRDGQRQAIFALARGHQTIAPVDVIAGPGNAWVREAKRAVSGTVGIDSLAGPSELMLVAGDGTDPEWAALDLCAQAEHGAEGPLVAVAVEEAVLEAIADATEKTAAEHEGIGEAPLALVQVPDLSDAIDLANAFAPERLQLFEEDAGLLADGVRTAGCVFIGRYSATAFGDYAAGSNHVLPTGGAGRFSGPLGPGVFRRRIAAVRLPAEAAAKLAPHVDAIARAEGFPVHGESAMIRR